MAQGAAYRPSLGAIGTRAREGDGLGRLRWAVVGAVVALAIELLYIAAASPRFAVREVVVRGDPRVTELVAPRVALPANTNSLRAPTGLLAERAEQVPAVREARVRRALPGRLVVTVERREAVAVVRESEQAVLIDPDGEMFAVRDEWGWGLPELAAPHLTGGKAGSAAGKAEVAELLGALRVFGPGPRLRVTRLELAPDGKVTAMLESGAEVRLGTAKDLEVKVSLLLAALDRLGADQIEYIDVSDPWAAYWRPRGGSRAGRGSRQADVIGMR